MIFPPLALYIHFPWCVSKCPYCDFNSHVMHKALPQQAYKQALLNELAIHLPQIKDRPIISIFIGGGTPSLIDPSIIKELITSLQERLNFTNNIEITMEANPNSIDRKNFHGYREAGINRLSIGIQSFSAQQLKQLGRAHNPDDAMQAIEIAREAGFNNLNLDLMHGLPNQTIDEALQDLHLALNFKPEHLSWYQLTLEPETPFYHQPPTLPLDDTIAEMQLQGQALLKSKEMNQYEVSAYALPNNQCKHNLNYWQFGDYVGIGAGAHSKLSFQENVKRWSAIKYPNAYIQATNPIENQRILSTNDLLFEFMLNHCRLSQPIMIDLFEQRTGLQLKEIAHALNKAVECDFLQYDNEKIILTVLGKRYLNELLELFL